MKADISRTTFRRTRHYSGVRLQQGRVQLDSDFNEQVDIGANRDRVTTRDVVGPAGAPDVGGGFKIGTAVLLSAVAFTGQRGIAVGGRGTVVATGDGGATWALSTSGVAADLSAVSVVNATNAWAVGAAKTIVKGNPTTAAWQTQSAPANVTSDLRGVHFPNATTGFAVGTGAVILNTTDGGTGWTRQSVPQGVVQDLNAVFFPTGATGYAVGDAGRILKFSGGSWTAQSPPTGFAANLRAVAFASAQVGWAVGDGGTILSTTDGGTTWVLRDPPLGISSTLRAVTAESATIVWAAGDDGTIIRSTDGGATWTLVAAPAGFTADLYGLAVRPGSSVVAAGDLSTVMGVPATGAWTAQALPAQARDLSISAGRLYVDGIACENDRAIRYGAQPDLPGAPAPGSAGNYLVYVDVWQRHLTAIEEPSLREEALGGPDTATRTKTVCQVKLEAPADVPPGATCDTLPPDWTPVGARSTGRLRARAQASQVQTDECMVPAAGGYRRLENQLYRVEIHDDGTGAAATYKWSRDNGSPLARLEAVDPKSSSDFTTGELTVSSPGRDAVTGFAQARWVELSDEGRALRGEPGILLEVDTVTGDTIKWKNYTGSAFSLAGFPSIPIVRRWEGADSVAVGTFEELEGGVFVEFDGGDYRTGDYWTIPARTRTGTVEWPTDDGTPIFQGRQGIEHRYAPLAFVQLTGDLWSNPTDCRDLFPPLTGLTRMFVVGGDGQEANPKPGDPLTALPQPIEVGVMNGRLPVAGTTVRYSVVSGGGKLGPARVNSIDVQTDALGIAGTEWLLGGGVHSQRVDVRLLNEQNQPIQTPIHFYASLSTADAVAYDPAACNKLQGKNTVQEAIDELCKHTGSGSCTVHAFPGDDLQAAVDSLPSGGGELCLAAGGYALDKPLNLASRKGVVVAGRGGATVLRASGEIVIGVYDCDGVAIRDLRVEGGGGPNDSETHLLGAITILRSRNVDVTGCELVCEAAAGRARTCLSFYGLPLPSPEGGVASHPTFESGEAVLPAPPPDRIRIERNRFEVGAFQTGALLVNVNEATVADNWVGLSAESADGARALKGDVQVLAAQAETIGRAVAAVVAVNEMELPAPPVGPPEHEVRVRHRDGAKALIKAFATLAKAAREREPNDPRQGTIQLLGALRDQGLAESPRDAADAATAVAAELAAVGQGIVVGGERAGTVVVRDNVVDDAIEGIHAAVSQGKRAGRERGSELRIGENVVHSLVPGEWTEDRHAVYAGNFEMTSIGNTTATLRRPAEELLKLLLRRPQLGSDIEKQLAQTSVDAIRVVGAVGGYMVVRNSSLRGGFGIGVHVEPTTSWAANGASDAPLWLVAETVVDGGASPVVAPPNVNQNLNFRSPI